MCFKQNLKMLWIAIAMIVAILLLPQVAIAAGNSNQELNQPAMLVAPDPKTEINVYSRPGTGQRRLGYGLSGDRVIVQEQVGSNEGDTWDYVRFDSAAKTTKGWVRDDFIRFETTPASQSRNPQNSDHQNQAQFSQLGQGDLGNSQQNAATRNVRQSDQRQNSDYQQQNH